MATMSEHDAGAPADRPDDVPGNPREDPVATVDALDRKVASDFPDHPDEDPGLAGAGGGSDPGAVEPPD